MKIEALWTWDARIIGMGQTPSEDEHLTVIEGVKVPTLEHPGQFQFAFPIAKAHAEWEDSAFPHLRPHLREDARRHGALPCFAATRISLHMRLLEN